MSLRDALLAALASVPGTRTFHVHVLVSTPKKHYNLFPFATPRPKTFLQHILVLLAEETADSPRVFVSAIEAFLYHVPSTSSAVLYISKVDSTGQAMAPSPTPVLVRGLLRYYVDPASRPLPVAHLWVHLFARAQNQYLFPNSAEYPGKRPLSDVKLCAWWKRQLSIVAEEVRARVETCRLYYLLPGLGEVEATHAVDRVYAAATSVPWRYGHPYGEMDVGVPCPIGRGGHIGHVVPWFDDDPKARFLDEIAYTTDANGVRSPERKRPRTSGAREDAESGTSEPEEATKALRKVTVEEFWERMSFRQECVAGAMTGFFVMLTSSAVASAGGEGGEVSAQVVKRVLASLMTGHEFASCERAVWSTGVLEESIRGLCGQVDGSIGVSNPDEARKEREVATQITVLTARRKKRARI